MWLPEVGIGHYPVRAEDTPYDAAYFEKYERMADTGMGRTLTQARVDLVARHHTGDVLDVGIGCGQFVSAMPGAKGFDVNPAGVEWLTRRDLYRDLYRGHYEALTFWDSLEHIHDIARAVCQSGKWVFTSLPIFTGPEHVLRSRHFRPDEHIWYFTDRGIRWWFAEQGFECVEHSTMESDLGREDIGTYAFRRIR